MNTVNPDNPTAFGGHDDDDDNPVTRPTLTGQVGNGRVGAGQLGADQMSAGRAGPDQQLYAPLPYGAGFSTPQPLGFGVGPEEIGLAGTGSGSAIEVVEQKRSGSPVLAVAGALSMAVAVWAILGAPVITPTVLLAAGLVLTVLVGLVMVLRR